MSVIEIGEIYVEKTKLTHAIEIGHQFYNAGEKEIKYLTFSYLPYNSVNDIVACTVSGKTEVSGKFTGPLSPKHKFYVKWEHMWYNPTIVKVVLTRIHIQYMDDTEEMIEGKDVISINNTESLYYNNITLPQKLKMQREKKIRDASDKLCKTEATTNNISEVFSGFKDDEDSLIEIVGSVKIAVKVNKNIELGYLVGDYIEKEYSSNNALMGKAVSIWKDCIAIHQKYQFLPWEGKAKHRKKAVKNYSAKIKKYEPAYVIPKKTGCVTIGY